MLAQLFLKVGGYGYYISSPPLSIALLLALAQEVYEY